MKQLISEWLWRVAIVCTLGWIGFELHQIHEAMLEPLGETTTATAPEDVQDSIDGLIDDVATLNAKIDAIMMAMLQLKR